MSNGLKRRHRVAVSKVTVTVERTNGTKTIASFYDCSHGILAPNTAEGNKKNVTTSVKATGGASSSREGPSEAKSADTDKTGGSSIGGGQSGNNKISEEGRRRLASYASGGSTPPEFNSSDEDEANSSRRSGLPSSKNLVHSTSAIGLDAMIEERREEGDLTQNVVHIEVPFGKPIEEVYEGVHNGPVLGSGISGLVRLATHKKTGIKYAVKVLDLALVETAEGLRQLREEIFIMCQVRVFDTVCDWGGVCV